MMIFLLNLRSTLNEVGVIGCSACGIALKRFKVDPVQTEPYIETLEPFVVIDKGPVEIPADIEPFLQTSFYDIHVLLHVFYFLLRIM